MKAIEELIALIENDVGLNGNCKDEPDDDCVGWNAKGPMPMTFGHVRRARAELEALEETIDVIVLVFNDDPRFKALAQMDLPIRAGMARAGRRLPPYIDPQSIAGAHSKGE
jgi:hypothetical protein